MSRSRQNVRMPRSSAGKLTFESTGRYLAISPPASKTPRPSQGRGASPAVPPCLAGLVGSALSWPGPVARPEGLQLSRAGPVHVYWTPGRRSGGGSGRMFTSAVRRASTAPGSLWYAGLVTRSRRSLCGGIVAGDHLTWPPAGLPTVVDEGTNGLVRALVVRSAILAAALTTSTLLTDSGHEDEDNDYSERAS